MSSEQTPTTMVKGSNIGFILGILLVVGIGMYLFKSGFMSDKFGLSQKAQPTPTPSPVPEIKEEPITLLEETTDNTFNLDEEEVKTDTTESSTHAPVDTALGDSPIALIALVMMGAFGVGLAAKKLA